MSKQVQYAKWSKKNVSILLSLSFRMKLTQSCVFQLIIARAPKFFSQP